MDRVRGIVSQLSKKLEEKEETLRMLFDDRKRKSHRASRSYRRAHAREDRAHARAEYDKIDQLEKKLTALLPPEEYWRLHYF